MAFVLFIFLGVLQVALYVYLPAVVLFGFVKYMVSHNIFELIENPFFGVVKVSLHRGIIIWFFQLVLFGAILMDFANWRITGKLPFILWGN